MAEGSATGGVDLHAHSLHSDGALSPTDLLQEAAAAGLEAVALTDHDGVSGLEEAAQAAADSGPRLVPGIEISCREAGADLHLLGWFIDPEARDLRRQMARLAAAREKRLAAMLPALARAGVPVTEAAVRAHSGDGTIGRPHVAAALVEAGHARSMQHAFDRWIGRRRPGFVPLERVSAGEALAAVTAAGGVAGIAHPGLGVRDAVVESLAAAGLAALEVDHPGHIPGRRAHYRRLAARLGLVPTAGSDFHGQGDHHGPLGGERMPATGLAALEARRP